MTEEVMTLRALVEKVPDAELLHEMIGFPAKELMELEVAGLTGARYAEKSRARLVQHSCIRHSDWSMLLEARLQACTCAIARRNINETVWRQDHASRAHRLRDRRSIDALSPRILGFRHQLRHLCALWLRVPLVFHTYRYRSFAPCPPHNFFVSGGPASSLKARAAFSEHSRHPSSQPKHGSSRSKSWRS
ncbi:MAG: hypothetical protein KF815_13050 [Rhodospirillales bacterium]|nr:hypothetical protein [Rhodospirillales bacterium]